MGPMAEPRYAPGVPCWVDLSTPDLEATTAFYGQLFGWEPQEPAPDTGGYTMFHHRGEPVAAAMPKMTQDQPTVWGTYVSVPDAAATTRAVEAAGGKVLVPPMQVMAAGTMGVYADTEGAVFGCWQAGEFAGAGLTEGPGTFCWAELMCRDADGAKRFYPQVFGWAPDTQPFGDLTYTAWQVGGRGIAGMMPMGSIFPPEVPAHWGVYFAVADADAALARAEQLGASAQLPVTPIEGVGRFAGLVDPQGAAFSILQPNPR